MAVLGGMGTVFGPVIGAIALLVLEEALPILIGGASQLLTGHEVQGAREYWQLILGPMLLLIVLFARGGIDGLLARPRGSKAVADALLTIDGLTKRFGGVVASDNVRLDVTRGELHAIIGPNGAGKTTLIGQLAGEIVPERRPHPFRRPGHHRAAGAWPEPDGARRARSRSRRCFRISPRWRTSRWRCRRTPGTRSGSGGPARAESELREPARAALERVGLGHRANTMLGKHEPRRAPAVRARQWRSPRSRACCFSTSRWRVWAPTNPRGWCKTLREFKRELTILLIEHDMEAVFALADRITVLVYGRVIASGAPAEIRANRGCSPGLSRRAGGGYSCLSTLLDVDEHRDALWAEPGAVRHVACPSRRARWSR